MGALLAVGSLAPPVCGSCAEQDPGGLVGFGGCKYDRMRVSPGQGILLILLHPPGLRHAGKGK